MDDTSLDTTPSTDHSWDDDSTEDDIDIINTDSVSSNDHAIHDKGNLVLELHDIRRESATENLQEPKGKKFRKKKLSRTKSKTGQSSSRSSEGSFPLSRTETREEFYDAHESYHGLPGKPAIKTDPSANSVSDLEHSQHALSGVPKTVEPPDVIPPIPVHSIEQAPVPPIITAKPVSNPVEPS